MRSVILAVALVLALTPLSLLFDPLWAAPIAVLSTVSVIAVGALARSLSPRGGMNAVLQLGAIVVGATILDVCVGTQSGRTLNPATWIDAHLSLIDASARQLSSTYPPVPGSPELTVMLALVIALVTLLIDILFTDLAWRTPTAITLLCIALIPAVHVGDDVSWAVYVGPIAGAALILASDALTSRPLPGITATAAVTAVTLALAPVIAPALTMGISPTHPVTMWTLRSEGAGLPSSMINDSVSVRRTLNEKDERTIATYQAAEKQPVYLRSRVLTDFDGESFRAPSTEARDEARQAPPAPTDTNLRTDSLAPEDSSPEKVPFTITLGSLSGDRVPVPAGLRGFGGSPDFDPSAAPASFGEVEVVGGAKILDGQKYYVDSEVPQPDVETLRDITADDIAQSGPGVPINARAPESLNTLADDVKKRAGASTPLEAALAYQAYFQDFRYSLTTTTPAGADPLESFLEDRVGYCEQFAATFALMMNSQGYPTRVVVGFTGGTTAKDGTFQVTNRDAHAWPEVWFGPEVGWVRFEPTPASGGEGIRPPAGLGGSRREADGNQQSQAPSTQATPEDSTDGEGASTPTAGKPSHAPSNEASDGGTETKAPSGTGSNRATQVMMQVAAVIGVLLGAAALVATVLLARRLRRRLHNVATALPDAARQCRWAAAHGTAHELGAMNDTARTAYREILAAAAAEGIDIPPSYEPHQALAVIAQERPCIHDTVEALTPRITSGLYAPASVGSPSSAGPANSSRAEESHDTRAQAEALMAAIRNGCGDALAE